MADTSVAFLLPGWAGSVELILNNKKFIVYIHNVHAVIFVLTNTKKKTTYYVGVEIHIDLLPDLGK